ALLAHDVDAINAVPPSAIPDLKGRSGIRVVETGSARPTFLDFDTYSDRSPYVTDRAGEPLDRNPLKDVRVRIAISKSINRHTVNQSRAELHAARLLFRDRGTLAMAARDRRHHRSRTRLGLCEPRATLDPGARSPARAGACDHRRYQARAAAAEGDRHRDRAS